MRERTGPGARAALVGAAAVCLLALVGLASRGGLGRAGSAAAPSQSVLDWGFSVFFVLYVLGIPIAIWAYWQQARNAREQALGKRRRGRFLQNAFVFLAFLAIAVGLTRYREGHLHAIKLNSIPSGSAHGSKRGVRPTPTAPRFRWPVAVVFGVAAAGGAAAYVVLRRRKGPLRPLTAAAELELALDDALDDVRAERDPRRAVIKAYARLEAVLAAHGVPRGPAETPYEYLARALDAVDASAPSVGRLTDLYERARFSLHEIDGGMREEAIGALTAVRDELRGEA